jgi:hypothetical protein
VGVKGGRSARKADNLTAICKPTVLKTWEPQPYGPPRPVTGISLRATSIANVPAEV